jgi:GTP cyclohydrolase III
MRRYEFENADDANAIHNAASVQECTLAIAKKYSRGLCAILGFLGRDNVRNRPPAAQLKVQGRQAIHLQFRSPPLLYLQIGARQGRKASDASLSAAATGRGLREHAGNRKTSQQLFSPQVGASN